jgi:hypothetical protein
MEDQGSSGGGKVAVIGWVGLGSDSGGSIGHHGRLFVCLGAIWVVYSVDTMTFYR